MKQLILLAMLINVTNVFAWDNYAICTRTHGIGGTWSGPLRADRMMAQRDADSHNAEYTGHNAEVFSGPSLINIYSNQTKEYRLANYKIPEEVIHTLDVTVTATYPEQAIAAAKAQVRALGHSPISAYILSGNSIVRLYHVRVECWCHHAFAQSEYTFKLCCLGRKP